MLEPKTCLVCSALINPLPPVNATNFEEPYPPDFWEVNCPNCHATITILRTDLPEELIRELEESRVYNLEEGVDEELSLVDEVEELFSDPQNELDIVETTPEVTADFAGERDEPLYIDDSAELGNASTTGETGDDELLGVWTDAIEAFKGELDAAPQQNSTNEENAIESAQFSIDSDIHESDSPEPDLPAPDLIDEFFGEVVDVEPEKNEPYAGDDHFESDIEVNVEDYSPSDFESQFHEEEAASFQATWTDDSTDEPTEVTPKKTISAEDIRDRQNQHYWNSDAPSDSAGNARSFALDQDAQDPNAAAVAAVQWDKSTNDSMLKRKKEPSLLRKVLPPLLGAAAALPIALAILWYGFGKDLGGIGEKVAQFAPAIVPEHLRGQPVRPTRSTLPPPPTSAIVSEEATAEVESSDITELGQPDAPPAIESIEATETIATSPNPALSANADEQLVAPVTPTQIIENVQSRISKLVDTQERFLTIGASDRSQQLPLANEFWGAVQNLGMETNELFTTDFAGEAAGREALQQILARDIGGWGDGVLGNPKLATFLKRCAGGFSGLTDIGSPTILVESLHYPDEIDVTYSFDSEVKYHGAPIEIVIPGELLKALGKPDTESAPTLLIGSIEETNGKNLFKVNFALR